MAQQVKTAVRRVLDGETLAVPPIWLMRQAGRYLPEYRDVRARAGGFLDLCYTPTLAAEVTLQPIRRYGLDAAILFSDILVVPDALGRSVRFEEGVGPVLDPIDGKGVAALDPTGVAERLAPVYETVSRVREGLSGEVEVIGFAGAPWTVATYMVEGGTSRDHAATRRWSMADESGFQALMDVLVEATAAYLSRQVDAGAGVLQLFDSWAGALDEEGQRRWSIQPMREIARKVRERHPDVPIIAFARGTGANLQAYAAVPEFAGLGLDSGVPLEWAATVLQPRLAVQGNLDPMRLVAGGEPMRTEIRRIVSSLGHGPHIFNLGHGITPDVDPETVADLVATVRGAGG